MPIEVLVSGLLAGMMSLAVCLPLVPAVLIYRLFPKTRMTVRGPFEGLTLNVGGAFAAYFVMFLASLPLTRPSLTTVAGMFKPAWTVDAPLQIFDKDGNPVSADRLPGVISVVLEPELHRVTGGSLRVRIPGLQREDWPHVTVQVLKWGSGEIDLASLENVEVDDWRKIAHLNTPVVIREYLGARTEYEAKGYLNAQ